MTTVYCLFHDYSDYECSSETLVGVFESADDAETGLLKLVARGEKLRAENQEFDRRYRECHERAREKHSDIVKQIMADILVHSREDYQAEINQIADEQKAWRQKEFGSDFGDIPDTDVASYHIDEVEIGVIRV